MRNTKHIHRVIVLAVSLTATMAGSIAARPLPSRENFAFRDRILDRSANKTVFTGIVRENATMRPLEVVQILIDGQAVMAVTDTSGRYSLMVENLPRGSSVAVRARRIGFQVAIQTVKLSADTIKTDFLLTPAPIMLSEVAVMAMPVTPRTEMATSTTSLSASETRSVPLSGKTANVVSPPAPSAPAPTRSPAAAAAPFVPLSAGTARADAADKSRTSSKRLEGEVRGNREQYDRIEDNPFLAVKNNRLSTFSVDVDRASYGNVRRMLVAGLKPPADAVRIEEFINYFPYSLPAPRGADPIAVTTEVVAAPWQTKHQLVRVALKARDIEIAKLPPSNLVFLIDVSGSMSSPDKLPLVQASLRLLVEQLREQDRVAIVVYAGAAGLVLPSTSGENKAMIAEAIDRLQAGGSTAGGAGIQLAYKVAQEHFLREGNNRVILATDGDFNVGAISDSEMERLIESKRGEGTYLTVLGFGTGNYQDAKMEKLAKKGNGNYAYVDDIREARKTLVHELGATLVTVANDVKLQVEFNPTVVASYRLIGYEDRLLRNEDFVDDKKDAGDVGAGHSVTALYEIVPVGVKSSDDARSTDTLRYATPERNNLSRQKNDELLYVKLRYKRPGEPVSQLMTHIVRTDDIRRNASDDFRFAASVASFGMLLRDSEYKGTSNSASILEMARSARGADAGLYRAEFVSLVERWERMNRVAGR